MSTNTANIPLEHGTGTLSPLPEVLRHGLIGVTVLSFLSFIASVVLFFLLLWRLISWNRKNQPYNQFVLLIFNLVLADIQQSLAFLLNASWLMHDSITISTSTCWAQAWFVSTGDLASGVWCLAIGIHTFTSVILNYKVGNKTFYSLVFLLWSFIYAMAILQVALHPKDIFVRAGAWCWVNNSYPQLRLWSHYIFIFISEFGVVFVYSLMYFILNARIKSRYFGSTDSSDQARQAANLMVVYPLIYVVCTLPLACARMAGMTGHDPSFVHFCIAGAMITSNGWLDVLLYTLTRRIMLFSDNPPSEDNGLNTFQVPFWGPEQRYGTTTTIKALSKAERNASLHRTASSRRCPSRQSSTEKLFSLGAMDGSVIVKAETTVEVHSEPVELEDINKLKYLAHRARPSIAAGKDDNMSFDSKSVNTDIDRDFDHYR